MTKILYTSSKLNRYSEIRCENKRLDFILKQEQTKFLPVWDNMNFFDKSEHEIRPIFLNKKELCEMINPNEINLRNFIFLGELSGIYYFSINLSELLNEKPKFLNQKDILCEELRSHSSYLNQEESSLLALAKGMNYWHNNNKYCGLCGSLTKKIDGGFVLKCIHNKCGTNHFPRTDSAIITLVFFKKEILLARSPRFPNKMFSTLAGFVEIGETLEQTVKREVFEEVGINVRKISYFGSQPWPFPASLMLGFFAEAESQELRLDLKEIEDAQWFSLDQIKKLNHPNLPGGFKLPREDSIARRLVNHWLNKNID